MSGFDETGFEAKRVREVLEDIRNQYEAVTGTQPDWDRDTFLGIISAVMAERVGEVWQLVQEVYDARDPNNATGIQLDMLVALAGLTRKTATKGTTAQKISGDKFTQIPESAPVIGGGKNDEAEWLIVRDVTIGESVEIQNLEPGETYSVTINGITANYNSASSDSAESVLEGLRDSIQSNPQLDRDIVNAYVYGRSGPSTDVLVLEPKGATFNVNVSASGLADLKATEGVSYVQVRARQSGRIEASQGIIDKIGQPAQGWNSTSNTKAVIPGSERETDKQLRRRWFESIQIGSSSSRLAVLSELADLDFLQEVIVLENETPKDKTIQGVTVPRNSFRTIVYPPLSNEQIRETAKTIYAEKPIGILPEGSSETVEVEGRDGRKKEISFDYAQSRTVDVRTTLELQDTYELSDVEGTVKGEIEEYVKETISVGNDVRRLPMLARLDTVDGIRSVDSLELRYSGGSYAEDDLVIQALEFAEIGTNQVLEV